MVFDWEIILGKLTSILLDVYVGVYLLSIISLWTLKIYWIFILFPVYLVYLIFLKIWSFM